MKMLNSKINYDYYNGVDIKLLYINDTLDYKKFIELDKLRQEEFVSDFIEAYCDSPKKEAFFRRIVENCGDLNEDGYEFNIYTITYVYNLFADLM